MNPPSLEEIELDRWEWPAVDSVQDLWAMRTGSARLVWTPVEEAGAFVLNVLAPSGMIFWDFSPDFSPFVHGAMAFAGAECAREGSARRLADLCLEAGIGKRSFAAHVVYRGLTGAHGDAFFPERDEPDYFLMVQRHASVAVPAACREAVARYFHRQVAVFGARAFLPCDEAMLIYGDDVPQAMAPEFGLSVWGRTAAERSEIRRRVDECAHRPLHPFHATRGANIALPAGVLLAHEIDDFHAVTRFRVATILRHGTLCALQTMRDCLLERGGWDALALADLREELLGEIDARLHAFPIVQIDPYAQWHSVERMERLRRGEGAGR